MTSVTMLEENAKPKNEVADFTQGFSLPKHMSEHIYMFSGASVTVKLNAPIWMMDALVDWFGKDFILNYKDENNMTISLRCNEQAMLFWSMQYGKYVDVLEPQSLRDEIANTVERMYLRYCKKVGDDDGRGKV